MNRPTDVPAAPATAPGCGVDVIDRACAILFAFKAGEPPLTLHELSRRTGLYKSTLLRLAAALEHHRFLDRMEDGRFRVGSAPLTLGAVYQANLDVADVLLPIMRELNRDHGEAISFHVRERDHRVCLLRVNSSHAIRPEVRQGAVQSLDRGAGGRVLLAFGGEAGQPYEQIRRDHCYLSVGERDPEVAGISAPVFGVRQALIGALGIVGPVERLTRAAMEQVRGRLLRAAATATAKLGGDPAGLLAAAVLAERDGGEAQRIAPPERRRLHG